MWLPTLRACIFAPHQREHFDAILRNRYSFRVGCRQTAGKSFTLASAALTLATGFGGEPAHDVTILSKDDRTAGNLIREVARHVRAAEKWGPLADPKLGSLQRIALRNGQYIQSFPGRPDALQGFTGSVLVDEASQIEAGWEGILDQALSVSSRQPYFRVAVATNADYAGSAIDRFLRSEEAARRRAQWAVINTTIHDVYPEGLPPDIAAIRETISPNGWRRFFLNEFVRRSDGLLSHHLLDAAADSAPVHVGVRVLGIDPGVARHATGFVVARIGVGRVEVEDGGHVICPPEQLVEQLVALATQHAVDRIVIDPGTAGYMIAVELAQRIGGVVHRSAGQDAQDRWVETLQFLLARRAIRIPARLRDVIEDLESLEDLKGHVHAPERPAEEVGRVIHCDAALALLSLMDEPGVPQREQATYEIQSAGPVNQSVERRVTHTMPKRRPMARASRFI
jgi:hypothetical protein